jgi:hypothetical protein
MAVFAADAEMVGSFLRVDVATGLAITDGVTRQTFLVFGVVLRGVETGGLLLFAPDTWFQELEHVRHLGLFPGTVLFDVAFLASSRTDEAVLVGLRDGARSENENENQWKQT